MWVSMSVLFSEVVVSVVDSLLVFLGAISASCVWNCLVGEKYDAPVLVREKSLAGERNRKVEFCKWLERPSE